jgi:hypothetical protein
VAHPVGSLGRVIPSRPYLLPNGIKGLMEK